MTNEEMLALAEKMKNGTATLEEKESFFQQFSKTIAEMKKDVDELQGN